MAIGSFGRPVVQFFNKNKYIIIILVVGIVLMAFPSISTQTEKAEKIIEPVISPTETVEKKLESILRQINGAGNVSVMLTAVTGEETLYQVDTRNDTRGDDTQTDVETVILTDQSRKESGLVRQVNPPKYLGAIIVCQGADDPKVQLAITDAVSKITGLGANHISVLKMK